MGAHQSHLVALRVNLNVASGFFAIMIVRGLPLWPPTICDVSRTPAPRRRNRPLRRLIGPSLTSRRVLLPPFSQES